MPTRVPQKGDLLPRPCTLDGFTELLEELGGVDPTSLEPLTNLVVATETTTYQITLIDPSASTVVLQDRKFFPLPVQAQLCGSSFGGSFLKQQWIGIGMRIEFHCERGQIVTAPVVSVKIGEESEIAGPF